MELKDYYKPIGNSLVVKREDTTEGGIIIPDMIIKNEGEYEIICVGDECKHVCVGDTVLFKGNSRPIELEISGNKYLQFYEYDVLGIVDVTKRPAVPPSDKFAKSLA